VTELGVQGAISRMRDILSGAIASIPRCPGEALLARIVSAQAEVLTPIKWRAEQASRIAGE